MKTTTEDRQVALLARETALEARETALAARERALALREGAAAIREAHVTAARNPDVALPPLRVAPSQYCDGTPAISLYAGREHVAGVIEHAPGRWILTYHGHTAVEHPPLANQHEAARWLAAAGPRLVAYMNEHRVILCDDVTVPPAGADLGNVDVTLDREVGR